MWLWPETQILSFREQKAQAGSQKHGSHTTAPQAQIARFLKPRTHRLHFFMAPSPCLGEVCPLPRDGRRPALSSAPGTTKVRIPLAKGRVADARRTLTGRGRTGWGEEVCASKPGQRSREDRHSECVPWTVCVSHPRGRAQRFRGPEAGPGSRSSPGSPGDCTHLSSGLGTPLVPRCTGGRSDPGTYQAPPCHGRRPPSPSSPQTNSAPSVRPWKGFFFEGEGGAVENVEYKLTGSIARGCRTCPV